MSRTHIPLTQVHSPPVGTVGGSVLVIDQDHAAFGSELAARLRKVRFFFYEDRDRALRAFLKIRFDLVLLEHSNLQSCFGLLEHCKKHRPEVPFFILTGCGSEATAIRVFRLGGRDYFNKPLPLDELAAAMATALSWPRGDHPHSGNPASGLQKSLEFIESHLDSSLSLAAVAKEAGMSISTFVRAFKEATGETFTTFLNRKRVARAQNLLRDHKLSLAEIAFACGYSSQCYFSRTFKKFVHTSPAVYRRRFHSHP